MGRPVAWQRGRAAAMTDDGAILEIGHAPFLSRVRPRHVRFVAVGTADPPPDAALVLAGPSAVARLPALLRLLGDPALRLVVCRIHHHPGRSWRLVAALLRRACRVPLAVLDFEDEDILHPTHRPLLGVAQRVFKRELPVDRWRLARRQPAASVNEALLRQDAAARRLVDVLRPLPLGLPLGTPEPPAPMAKASDVFFVGAVEGNAWHRVPGAAELRALTGEGIVVDMPAQRLPPDAFLRRCAAARVTWSPAGHGWQCFRHAEAAACGSVPLMPYPTIETHAGFVDGQTAIFYDPRPGGLSAALRAALADPVRLDAMGAAARQHALRHLTPSAVADYILRDALGAGSRGSVDASA
jgi:hypothetical protein